MNGRAEAEAERILLENYEKYYRLAYSYVRSEQDALDVVQESAYKAIRDCGRVKDPRYISTWIYRIVVNTAIDLLRSRGREIVMENEERMEGPQPAYERLELEEVLDRLDEKEKAVIVLRYFQDMKLGEIGEVLDENVSTVKTRLYRALKKLRLELEDGGRERI